LNCQPADSPTKDTGQKKPRSPGSGVFQRRNMRQ
jgi:hypothetical protein